MARGPAVTPDEAAAWTKRYVAGESIEQIALDTGRTPRTVGKHIDPAVKRSPAGALRRRQSYVPASGGRALSSG
jgi:predicted transcriptional regulator